MYKKTHGPTTLSLQNDYILPYDLCSFWKIYSELDVIFLSIILYFYNIYKIFMKYVILLCMF